jgi:hypothetical protein
MLTTITMSTVMPTQLGVSTTVAAATQGAAKTGKGIAKTKKLSITADDQIAELYVDGVQTSFQQGGWQTVRVIDIPDDTQVIAVKATDSLGVS